MAFVHLFIPKIYLAEMISHALTEDPNECCGFLSGTDNRVSRIDRMRNVHQKKVRRFVMDPKEMLQVTRQLEDNDLKITAIYHSHTYTQAYPSDVDITSAIEGDWLCPYYVLISLVEKTRPVVRAFKINESEEVQEVLITYDGIAYRS